MARGYRVLRIRIREAGNKKEKVLTAVGRATEDLSPRVAGGRESPDRV